MKTLKEWIAAATPAERSQLAALAKTSVGQLGQLAGGHRRASSELAIRLEKASATIRKRNPLLHLLLREDMNSACHGCEFAKRCRK